MLDKLQVFDVYTLGLVLEHLPAAVRLAHRLRHPAHQAPPRGAARRAAEDPGAARRGWPASPRAPLDGGRPMPQPPSTRPARCCASGRLPGRAVTTPAATLGLRRARLPARDRQPRLPHRAHRRARRRRNRRRLRLQPGRGSSSRGRPSSTRSPTTTRSTPAASSTDDSLEPYSLALDELRRRLRAENLDASGSRSTSRPTSPRPRRRREQPTQDQVKVNEPLRIGGTDVYLLGNGYAPHDHRARPGRRRRRSPTPSRSCRRTPTSPRSVSSRCRTACAEQLGMIGFFYPTGRRADTGAYTSSYPDLDVSRCSRSTSTPATSASTTACRDRSTRSTPTR